MASDDTDPKAQLQTENARRRVSMGLARPGVRDSCDDRDGARPDGRFTSLFRSLTPDKSRTDSGKLFSKDSFESRYVEGDVLGLGAFSSVTLVRRAVVRRGGATTMACKLLRLSADQTDPAPAELSTAEQVLNEVSILRRLDHPNISKLVEVFEERDCFRLVMPLLSGGDLLSALRFRGSFAEDDARTIMRCLLSALQHTHSHGIAHRDIKLENLLLAEPHDLSRVVLIDFGLAKALRDDPYGSACGTPVYVAPEVITDVDRVTGLSRYGCECDLWSAGVVMYMLLSGSPPFTSTDVTSLLRQVRAAVVRFHDPSWELVSTEAKDLIRGLLTASPRARMTAGEALAHSWFADA